MLIFFCWRFRVRESKYDVKEEVGGGDGEVEVSGESVEDMLRARGGLMC